MTKPIAHSKRSPSAKPQPPMDRRVRRTRALLLNSLVTLVLEKGWDAVTVQDVCAHADVGRSTFYLHFVDKEEAFLSGFDDLRTEFHGMLKERTEPFAFALPLVEHAKENLRLFRALVGRASGTRLEQRFRQLVIHLVSTDLLRAGVGEDQQEHLAQFIGGGFLEMLRPWLDHPKKVDARKLAATFTQLAQGALRASAP